ncbi:MAG: cation-efflux pump [Anaerolineales bacterium]|nr:cation-efflux pump [Anaerolineales bacterium]
MNTATRAAGVQRVLWTALALNLAVTTVKFVAGALSGSLSILADAFQSLVDSASSVIGLVGIWASARPADANHPYGHHKYEPFAALGIGALLALAGYEIAEGLWAWLMGEARALEVTPLTLGLMALTFVINAGLAWFEERAGRRLNSAVLLADAAQTRSNLWVTLSVIAALVGARLGWPWLDPLAAFIVMLLIFRAAYEVVRTTSQVLTDVAVVDPQQVARIAGAVSGVTQVDGVRSRGRADAAYVDLSLRVDPAMTTEQAHNVASEVEQRIAAEIPGVVETLVHVEPQGAPGGEWERMAYRLRALADGLGLGLHDLHAHVERSGGYSLEMHLEAPAGLTLGEAHALADEFERRARRLLPNVRSLVTHLEPLITHLPDEAGGIADRADLRRRIREAADELAGVGACHDIRLHNVAGHLTATLHVTQPARQPLTDAHALAEAIERALHAREPSLHRVVIHVEPPEGES